MTTTTNGVVVEPTIPTAVLRGILTEQRQNWDTQRARLLISVEVQMEIANVLGVDKSDMIKDLEGQLQQCVVALRVLDAKLADLSPNALA